MRWVLGIVFLYAGGFKLMDPQALAVLIASYGIVPDLLVMPAAIGLPLFEVVAAGGWMSDIRGSLTAIGSLLLVFMAILGYGIWLGLDVDCGCFGPEDPESRAYHGLRSALYRDFIMLAGVLYLYAWRVCRRKSPHKLLEVISSIGPDKNKLIVIYCGFVQCTRSHNGAMWAVKNGYPNVYRFPGGIFAWKGAK
jgi:hypothetical protein